MKRIRKYIPLYIMAIPGLAYLVVNNYLPMFGLVIAFKKLDFRLGIWDSPWAGLQNFSFLFRTKDAFIITRNTILYNAAFIVVGTVLAIAIAILLNEIRSRLASRLYQSILLIPYLMSWVVVGYLAFAFLSSDTGYLNKALLRPLGLQEVSWYMEKKYWPFILILVNQ